MLGWRWKMLGLEVDDAWMEVDDAWIYIVPY